MSYYYLIKKFKLNKFFLKHLLKNFFTFRKYFSSFCKILEHIDLKENDTLIIGLDQWNFNKNHLSRLESRYKSKYFKLPFLLFDDIEKQKDVYLIGEKAINNFSGFRNDGSYFYGKRYITDEKDLYDFLFKDSFDLIDSRKLDGVRCLAVVDFEGKCTLYSRMGKELTTLNKVKEAIEKTNVINQVFDGEICLVDENGNEDFQGVMKQLRRKDHQILNPVFMIFDMIHKPDFDKQKGDLVLSERLRTLRGWFDGRKTIDSTLRYCQQYEITDDEHFETWSKISSDNKWEGFMIRKDVGYEGKRSKNLQKVKKFFDDEYEVIDYDVDNHEVVRDGKSETLKMLSQVWIEHKGHRVKVGSGWTQEQRLQYMDGSIVGKIITVQYFEETKNDKGGISLRFPTVKIVHGDKREV